MVFVNIAAFVDVGGIEVDDVGKKSYVSDWGGHSELARLDS